MLFKYRTPDQYNFTDFETITGSYQWVYMPTKTDIKKPPFPLEIEMRFGLTESIISRPSAIWYFSPQNQFTQAYYEWMSDVFSPEEYFFATASTYQRKINEKGQIIQGKYFNLHFT